MAKIVMKFGGTSVADTDRILHVAKLVKKKFDENNKVIVIVSAMAGVTNDLVQKSKKISENFPADEYDALLSSGEQVTSTLLSAALQDLGIKSRSWLGWQIPIVTDGDHKNSRIVSVNSKILNDCLDQNIIPVIPGFQGLSQENRITTIGRGGSDASAVAVAKCVDADFCEIYTDVDGVFTTNPDIESKAKKIDKISYEEMLEMASLGAKVMQSSSVQTAMINDVEIYVKSTFTNNPGTQILSEDKISYENVITGVAYSKDDAKITLQGVKDKAGTLLALSENKGYDLNRILYVGNDLNDFHVMKLCGYTACPIDSHIKIKELSNIELNTRGGEGVVRELLEDVLDLNFIKIL